MELQGTQNFCHKVVFFGVVPFFPLLMAENKVHLAPMLRKLLKILVLVSSHMTITKPHNHSQTNHSNHNYLEINCYDPSLMPGLHRRSSYYVSLLAQLLL